jgi:IS30 family transposase
MRVGFGKPLGHSPRLTAEERRRIVELRAQGKTLWEIAKLTGRSDTTVTDVLRKAREAA